ncbi:MAG: HipA domain-containing protein [Actinomycetota bacterium]|nr:HipA domain-containing protein [Actinomycetota bacterium]
MTSEPTAAFVWVWLPGSTEPVVAGRLDDHGDTVDFVYGRSYLARPDAVPLFLPELPLEDRRLVPLDGMRVAGCIADAGPDAWGQRVILRQRFGRAAPDADPGDVGLLTYLLESGSDRIGALDFQASATEYVPRTSAASLEELLLAAERLEAGEPFSPDLDQALLHGSSLGGARPKVLLAAADRRLIAKFARNSDPYPVVKAEGVAMNLARRVGLHVAGTEVIECLGRDVLLVERFDRTAVPGERRMLVSALTVLQLDERWGRYATYPALAEQIRMRFNDPKRTLRELFARIVFNICVGNTDDHARNHAAFWDGNQLTLTPAYDICPQTRSGGEAAQAMAIRPDGYRFSRLAGCISAAPTFLLDRREAQEIVDRQVHVIRSEWADAADDARLTIAERDALWGRQILNPYALEPEG